MRFLTALFTFHLFTAIRGQGQRCSWTAPSSQYSQQYSAEWTVDPARQMVSFTVVSEAYNDPPADYWAAIGFSNDNKMPNSDVVIGWSRGGVPTIYDGYMKSRSVPHRDIRQNIGAESISREGLVTTMKFERPIAASDSEDVSLFNSTTGSCVYMFFPVGGGFVIDLSVNTYPYQHQLTPEVVQVCLAGCVDLGGFTRFPQRCSSGQELEKSSQSVTPTNTPTGCSTSCDDTAGCTGFNFNLQNNSCTLFSNCSARTDDPWTIFFSKRPWPDVDGYTQYEHDCPRMDIRSPFCEDCNTVEQCAEFCNSLRNDPTSPVNCVGFSFVQSNRGCYPKTGWCLEDRMRDPDQNTHFYRYNDGTTTTPTLIWPDLSPTWTLLSGDCQLGYDFEICDNSTCNTVDRCSDLCELYTICTGFSFTYDFEGADNVCYLKSGTCIGPPVPRINTRYYNRGPWPVVTEWPRIPGFTLFPGYCNDSEAPMERLNICQPPRCTDEHQCASHCNEQANCGGFTYDRVSLTCTTHGTQNSYCFNVVNTTNPPDVRRYYRRHSVCDWSSPDGNYQATWVYEPTSDQVTVRIEVDTSANTKWAAIGFSPDQRMANSDVFVGVLSPAGQAVIEDRWITGYAEPVVDSNQNVISPEGELNNANTIISFTRERVSTDTRDLTLGRFPDMDAGYYMLMPTQPGSFDYTPSTNQLTIRQHVMTPLVAGPFFVDYCQGSLPCLFNRVPGYTMFNGYCSAGGITLNTQCLACNTEQLCADACNNEETCSGFEFNCHDKTCTLKNYGTTIDYCFSADRPDNQRRYYRKDQICSRQSQRATTILKWWYDSSTQGVIFEVQAFVNPIVAVGFSTNAEVDSSDVITISVDSSGVVQVEERAIANGQNRIDPVQNVEVIGQWASPVENSPGHRVTVQFKRPIDSADGSDLDIPLDDNCVDFYLATMPSPTAMPVDPEFYRGVCLRSCVTTSPPTIPPPVVPPREPLVCRKGLRVVKQCYGRSTTLDCAKSEAILVVQANFGRPSIIGDTQCGDNPLDCLNTEQQCGFEDIRSIVGTICNNRQQCTFDLNALMLNFLPSRAPCQACTKYVQITYVCKRDDDLADRCVSLVGGLRYQASSAATGTTLSGCRSAPRSNIDQATCSQQSGCVGAPWSSPVETKCGAENSPLNTEGSRSWCASPCDTSPWLMVDLGAVYNVSGYLVQGKRTQAQYVTEFTIESSLNNEAWNPVTDKQSNTPMVFGGNSDSTTVCMISFETLVTARYLRLTVQDFVEYPSMHFEPIMCPQVVSCGPLTISNSDLTNAFALPGQSVNVRCNPGYATVNGQSSYSTLCRSDGTFETQDACQSAASLNTCGQIPLVTNALHNGRSTSIGSNVTYTCNAPFRLQGSAQITCRRDGTWTQAPTCQQ